MAMVDFSNAAISFSTPFSLNNAHPFCLNSGAFWDGVGGSSGQTVNSGNCVITTNTATKIVLSYTGTFTKSGTEFYFQGVNWWDYPVKVSNINFSAGDTYDFSIEVTASGS